MAATSATHGLATGDEIADFMRAQGADPVRVAVINEKRLVHADSIRHHEEGVALAQEQYAMLPGIIAQPDWTSAEAFKALGKPTSARARKLAADVRGLALRAGVTDHRHRPHQRADDATGRDPLGPLEHPRPSAPGFALGLADLDPLGHGCDLRLEALPRLGVRHLVPLGQGRAVVDDDGLNGRDPIDQVLDGRALVVGAVHVGLLARARIRTRLVVTREPARRWIAARHG